MKKFITKFWGVGLIVVLLSSLFIAAVPTSAADPLNWEMKVADTPAAIPFAVLAPGTNIADYDINGMTMYAVTGVAPAPFSQAVMQSNNAGGWWSDISTRMPADIGTADYVAIAPDDPNVVVVADATPAAGLSAAITINGGTSWTSMGFIQDGTGTNLAGALNGVTISPMVTGGVRYIAAYGSDAAGAASVFYYNYGAGVGAWRDATDAAAATDFVTGPVVHATAVAYDDVAAFEFSPNFPSDWMASAILVDNGTAAVGAVDYHILSFNSRTWDTAVATLYPIIIKNGSAAATPGITVNKADLALLPDYDGSDESLRIAFAGLTILDGTTAGPSGGIWRCYDNAPAVKIYGSATLGQGTDIASVAFDGTNLAAGAYLTNNIFRSADPLATAPTFLPARTLKRIGIDDAAAFDTVLLKFDGETLYGGKIGDGSAISKSLDYGNTWNDYSLLDSSLTTIQDIYMTAGGNTWYLAATDGTKASVYRMSNFGVTRVLCELKGALNLILRGLDSDEDVIYAADMAGTVIYYSADGGTGRWYKRSSVPIAAIADLVVESAQVIYIGDPATVNVYKSVNAGFTWSLPMNCGLTGANTPFSMANLGENELVIGGTWGGVVYTADGGTTWRALLGVLNTFTPVYVAASGLGASDYVFAAETGAAVPAVWRCSLDPSNFLGEFKNMNAPAQGAATAEAITGIAYTDGVLYVLSSDATAGATSTYLNRTLAPTVPLAVHPAFFWGTQWVEAGLDFTDFWALKTSGGAPGSIMLYAVDQGDPPRTPNVYYYDDAVALGGPALIGPADNDRIDIVSPLTGAVAAVNFTWNRISLATGYDLFIALDDGFTELVVAPPIPVGTVALPNANDPVSRIQAGGTFLPGTTYYWRVAATLPIGSAFSETRSFVVQPTAASVPTIASPENGGSIDSTTPAFSWTPAAGATMYQFQLSTDPAFATTLMDEQLESAGILSSAALDRGTTYFWRVKALEPVDGDWSTVANFMIAEEAPAPAAPVVIEQVPAPVIEIPPAPPANVIEIPPAPAPEQIAPAYIWAIIIIGAVLVIAVIVLVVRTRRQV